MLKTPDFITARELLYGLAAPVAVERVSLLDCGGRVLAQDLIAEADIPPFDRSPYDGYAFRSGDTAGASREAPVTLRILEEIPAGGVPHCTVTEGTAVKLLTGAPIPPGADAVINFEVTKFTGDTVTLFSPVAMGQNVVCAGEDVKKGSLLARTGTPIDAGIAGTLAAQGVSWPLVYRIPRVAVLSTGSELVEADEIPETGMIRNSNAYSISAALCAAGLKPVYLGIARDTAEDIAEKLSEGLASCDAVISTGGVSVGDYDLTPAALDVIGAETLVRGVKLKPGMACAYARKKGKLICALSGNPASSLTNFYVVVLPALKRLRGLRDGMPEKIELTLQNGFDKQSKGGRVLRGTLVLRDGRAEMKLPPDQGNVVLSSAIGCNVMAVVPAGSGPLEAGTMLKGFML